MHLLPAGFPCRLALEGQVLLLGLVLVVLMGPAAAARAAAPALGVVSG
jgi:hypothetical protein